MGKTPSIGYPQVIHRVFGRNKWAETRLALIESRVDAALAHLVVIEKRLDATAPAVLRADLDDLRAAIDVDRAALRKQLGRVWGRIGRDQAAGGLDLAHESSDDPEFNALIALQRAHSQPGGS